MIPNINNKNHEPDHLRSLIDKIGAPQRAIARQLGVNETLFRRYITKPKNRSYRPCPYLVQFALEVWAHEQATMESGNGI